MQVSISGWESVVNDFNKTVRITAYQSLRETEALAKEIVPEMFYKLLVANMLTEPMYGPHIDNVRKEFQINVTRGGNVTYGNHLVFTMQTNPIERRGEQVDIGQFWLTGRGEAKNFYGNVQGPWNYGGQEIFAVDPSHGDQEPRLELAMKALEEAIYMFIAGLEVMR